MTDSAQQVREAVAKGINRKNWQSDEIAAEHWQDDLIRAIMFDQADGALAALASVAQPGVVPDDFDRRLQVLCDEGWRFHAGEPPEYDSPLSQVFDAGIGYAWERLAELLGVTDYEGGDGSEDYATDVTSTGRNILVAAGYCNDDRDLLTADELRAAHPFPVQGAAEASAVEAMREVAFRAGHAAAEETLGAHGSEHLLDSIERSWEQYRVDTEECLIPPKGWRRTRTPGHSGPCAAIRALPAAEGAQTGWTLDRVIGEARATLQTVEACLDCNVDEDRHWRALVAWLERLA